MASTLADDESTVTALFRFRKAAARLVDQPFEQDLRVEVFVITGKHFVDLVEDYIATRGFISATDAKVADATLNDAVDRLTTRLQDTKAAQGGRNLRDLQETGTYLRSRHPIAKDDPFAD